MTTWTERAIVFHFTFLIVKCNTRVGRCMKQSRNAAETAELFSRSQCAPCPGSQPEHMARVALQCAGAL